MILRALFWIAVVGILMPHEPDLGLGRPGAAAAAAVLPASAAQWAQTALGAPQKACGDHPLDCAAALGMLDGLQNVAVRSLAQVKADIEQSQRERARRAFGG